MLDSILQGWYVLLIWLAIYLAIFSSLEVLWPCNPKQPLLRKDAITDILYSFIIPVLTRFVRILFIGAAVYYIFYGESKETIREYMRNGFGPLGAMPIWWQAAYLFMISDVILYWTHRWFHTGKMWRWHAIHHSSEQVDWLSTFRFHPVNTWLSFTLVDCLMMLIGFSPEAVATLAIFNGIYSPMVHANVNWTFGPFKYLFASPVFHRWHHTADDEGMNKNFAPTFPLIDVIFGTFYMPEGRLPEKYGVPGANIPQGFIGQMLWPFKQK